MKRTWIALGAVAVAVVAFQGEPRAQTMAGSESFTTLTQELCALGGRATSPGFLGEHGAGEAAGGWEASSETFRALGGVVWTDPTLAGAAPVLISVTPREGPKVGGTAVTILGANFLAPGAGPPAVAFAGTPAMGVSVVSNTTITADTPAGTNVCGNPLVPASVSILNGNGLDFIADGFTYLPAFLYAGVPSIGQTITLVVRSSTPATIVIARAIESTVPGICVPVAPFGGTLELIAGNLVVLAPASSGGVLERPLDIPNKPGLVGVNVDFQAVAIPPIAPLTGDFTNSLRITIQP